ncbi:MAG: thioesterase family protein [Minwuia sp.]|uniref:thioesterase family protein n=1 Tax=Minwuia sp. TaxID=2493630 RepID=UPI003A87CF17
MTELKAPLAAYRDTVRPEWIDHNGHMNMGYYMVVFDYATDEFFDHCGLTRAHRAAQNITTFSLEAHINYLNEVREGDPLHFRTYLLDFDEKRIHYIHEMWHGTENYRAATNELMSLHVSQETRRAAPMHQDILDRLGAIRSAQTAAGVEFPSEAGRSIGLKNRRR